MHHIILSWSIAVVMLACGRAFAATELQAGIAVVDITPPVPFRMSGYFSERLSTGVKDPLRAKAIVFQQSDESAALVFCDLIGIELDVSNEARQRASERTGIPGKNIAITATHSHTGPLYAGALRNDLHERAVARSGKDPYETMNYPAFLTDQIVTAIVEAHSALQPVQLAAGNVKEDRLSFNRRFFMKDGSVRFNPGQLNPDIVRAVGPIDPQVGIVAVMSLNNAQPSAAIVAFALHLDTTGGTEYSADYPKFAEDRLRQLFGPEFALLFGAGTCGDINHVDVTKRDRRTSAEIGQMLGETIAQSFGAGPLSVIDAPSLAVRSAKVPAPLQKYSADEIADAGNKMDQIGSRELPFLEQVKACTIMDLELLPPDTLPLEVQVFRLDANTAIVTLPGEVFVELGLAIKAASPFATTLVLELSNGSPAYVPTRKAFVEGSYEVVNSRIQPGGGEQLVEAAIGLLKELK